MTKIRPQQYPDIIVRPSGIWNSRSPFHNFLNLHRLENRAFHIQMLSVEKLRINANQQDGSTLAKDFFMQGRGSKIAGRSFIGYKRSFPKPPDNRAINPTIRQVRSDLELLIPSFTEYALISYSSLFEAFFQCWALNHLLALLENSTKWSASERNLAMSFCPILNKGHIPSVLDIGRAIPSLVDGLKNLPHIHTNPNTGKEYDRPITSNLNAWNTILFWRDWRNLLIHRSGVISQQFLDEYKYFFEEFRNQYYDLPPLKRGEKLKLFDITFTGMVTTHYKAARWMNQSLETSSNNIRGHPYYPNPKPEEVYWENPPEKSPPLLLPGDHELSLKWEKEGDDFRKKFSEEHFGVKM